MTTALWTISFPAAAPASATRSIASAGALLLGVTVGTSTWYCGFATAIALLRRRLGTALLRRVDIATGGGLIGFGGYLGYRSLRVH